MYHRKRIFVNFLFKQHFMCWVIFIITTQSLHLQPEMSAMCGQLLLKTEVNSLGSSKWDFKTLWVNELPKRRSVLCLITLKSCGSSAEPLGGINLSCSEGEGSFPQLLRCHWRRAASPVLGRYFNEWLDRAPCRCVAPGASSPASAILPLVFGGALWGAQRGCGVSCSCQPRRGEGALRSQACSCPAVRLGSICKSLQPMPGTLLVVGLGFVFFFFLS